MNVEAIQVEQTLHGYRDGHELLRSSVDLSPQARRAMLVLSDLAGENAGQGFQTYLTGYPVPSSKYYAFARTWCATEMTRPGCVWTHSLLIPREHLADLSASILREAFTRPSTASYSFEGYGTTLLINSSDVSEEKMDEHRPSRQFVAEVAEALYSNPSQPILLAACSAAEYENFVLGVWKFQSKYYSDFSFSTGSLAFRAIRSRVAIDLQVIPRDRWRHIIRGAPASVIALYEGNESDGTTEAVGVSEWAKVAAEALYSHRESLNSFLEYFTSDTSINRRTLGGFIRACVLCEQLREGGYKDFFQVYDFVGKFFNTGEAVHLKKALSAAPGTFDFDPIYRLSDLSRLKVLLTTRSSCVELVEPEELSSRCSSAFLPSQNSLWSTEGLSWLVNADLTELGVCERKKILRAISSKMLIHILAENQKLGVEIIRRDHSRLFEKSIWLSPPEIQRVCLLASLDILKDNNRGLVVAALSKSGSATAGEEAMSTLGSDVLPIALDMLNQMGVSEIKRSFFVWRSAIEEAPSETKKWLQALEGPLNGLLLSLMAEVDISVLDFVRVDSISSAVTGPNAVGYESNTSAALALSIAFRTTTVDGAIVASLCFERVHSALMKANLDMLGWHAIRPLLPTSFFSLFDWDRAERLRRGYADRFMSNEEWSARYFVRGLSNMETRRRVRAYCEMMESGRKLLRKSGV